MTASRLRKPNARQRASIGQFGRAIASTPRRRLCLISVGLCVITLLAYLNSFGSGFVLDNAFHILGSVRVHQAKLTNVALIFNHDYWWPHAQSHLYRPITTLTYLFNYAVLGNAAHPAGYHWFNLLLHAVNVLLVFALARRLTRQSEQSFLIAGIWAVHPILTESVTNIVGRADLLAGMTTLAGLLIYLRSTEASGPRKVAWLAALMAVTAVGVFSKESAAAILGVIALYEITWWDRRRLPAFLMGCLAMTPPFVAMWLVRASVFAGTTQAPFPFVDNPIAAANFWIGRLTAIKVMAYYLGLMLWPAHLSVDYSYAQVPLVSGALADWISCIVVAAALVLAGFLYRWNKAAFFAAGFAFVTLLPMSNLVVPIGTIMAERFLYLPAVGMAICLTLALYYAARLTFVDPVVPLIFGMLIIAALTARTWVRNADWRTDLTLWSSAVQNAPLSFKTHIALAKSMLRGADPDGDAIYHENSEGLRILDTVPDRLNDASLYYDIAGQLILVGDSLQRVYVDGRMEAPPDSLEKYHNADNLMRRCFAILKAQHKSPDAFVYLMQSQVDSRLGKIGDAFRSALAAREAQPMVAPAYLRIHEILLARGRRDEAIATLLEGLILTSDGSLRAKLVEDYASDPDESVCATAPDAGSYTIDTSCQLVRKQACSVSGEVLRLASKAGGAATEARVKTELAKYGCSVTP